MDHPRKHQVSLRGASAKEITRDALLEKVSQEREIRNYARRANAAALFIQRVWRRYSVTRTAALQFREEWESLIKESHGLVSGTWISSQLLRPFLYFTMCLSTKHRKIQARDLRCMQNCFKILLESINSADPRRNFCSLAIGTVEERKSWTYQTQKLVNLCSCILAACDNTSSTRDIVGLTSLAMRLLVALSDLKGWKMVTDANVRDADIAVKRLICFMGRSDLYLSIRIYIMKSDAPLLGQRNNTGHSDVKFLITASAITLALRPFHVMHHDGSDASPIESYCAPRQFCLFLLTIPWIVQKLPAVLLPAIKHKSVLLPCFETLLIMKGELSTETSEMDLFNCSRWAKEIPPVGWALANITCLLQGKENGSLDTKLFGQGLDYALYVRVIIVLAENLFNLLEHVRSIAKEDNECVHKFGTSAGHEPIFIEEEATSELLMSYMDQFRPICQQSHLMELLAIVNINRVYDKAVSALSNSIDGCKVLKLVDVAYFYSCLLRVFSVLNPVGGSFPVLNTLAFTPGFLASLWVLLENKLFNGNAPAANVKNIYSGKEWDLTFDENHKHERKGGGSKWSTIVHKITGKSQAGLEDNHVGSSDGNSSNSLVDDDASDIWDVEVLRCGPQQLSKDICCLLHLFCATYSHLLLVLDDIEFYEKQVPFRLEQQRRIASVLNTLVYNGQSHNGMLQIKSLMESATKCLHLLYERDCRHPFCPPALWLSPARKNRPPIAIAARTHEVLHAKSDDLLMISSTDSVITNMPHVYPFEERVEMFRELIKMDKVSRTVAGEVSGPGSRNVEIVVRRGHIVEDGFQQLNSLGSRLKASIHVSFVSECGLPEAGLDYGGLSKEFLTDLSKLAFSPEYGLFSQTSTEDRLLIPNTSAKYLENGLQMIEFLGRVVGKALYEGILLDYAFSHVFVHKLLGRYSFLDELSTVDPELYRNLMYVKHYEGDVKELSLDFTVTEESFGKRHVIELRPGGKDACVTNENKMQYIHAIADYKLNRQILPFANAFYRGLTDLVSPYWLKLFNASEFNQLLSGGSHDIDIDDLRSNTRYTGGYTEGSRTIKLFWEVMKGFEPKERCLLLKFVTSCSRPPLLGFKYLHPTFTIHKVACDVPLWATIGGQDVDRLPSASTCYNTLKLPTYKRPSTLRAKLLYAISSNAGFELS